MGLEFGKSQGLLYLPERFSRILHYRRLTCVLIIAIFGMHTSRTRDDGYVPYSESSLIIPSQDTAVCNVVDSPSLMSKICVLVIPQ